MDNYGSEQGWIFLQARARISHNRADSLFRGNRRRSILSGVDLLEKKLLSYLSYSVLDVIASVTFNHILVIPLIIFKKIKNNN